LAWAGVCVSSHSRVALFLRFSSVPIMVASVDPRTVNWLASAVRCLQKDMNAIQKLLTDKITHHPDDHQHEFFSIADSADQDDDAQNLDTFMFNLDAPEFVPRVLHKCSVDQGIPAAPCAAPGPPGQCESAGPVGDQPAAPRDAGLSNGSEDDLQPDEIAVKFNELIVSIGASLPASSMPSTPHVRATPDTDKTVIVDNQDADVSSTPGTWTMLSADYQNIPSGANNVEFIDLHAEVCEQAFGHVTLPVCEPDCILLSIMASKFLNEEWSFLQPYLGSSARPACINSCALKVAELFQSVIEDDEDDDLGDVT